MYMSKIMEIDIIHVGADSILHMEMPSMEISIVVVQLLVIDRLRWFDYYGLTC